MEKFHRFIFHQHESKMNKSNLENNLRVREGIVVGSVWCRS